MSGVKDARSSSSEADRDAFQPLTREDVSDLAGLPRRFDLFVADTRQSFELLTEKLITPIVRIGEQVTDVVLRVAEVERAQHEIRTTQQDHARRIEALEVANTSKRKRKKK